MHRNDGAAKKGLLSVIILAAALLLAMLPGIISGVHAEGEDTTEVKTVDTSEDVVNKDHYLNGYYEGTVNKDGSAVRELPGSKNKSDGKKKDDILKTSKGKQVILSKGTKVLIFGEQRDSDADVWYHVQVTFENEVFVGYVYSGRVTASDTLIAFTPTPTPSPEITEEVPTPTIKGENGLKEPTTAPSETTSNMVEKAKKSPWSIWKLLLILLAAFVSFVIIYMIVNHYAEKKIDEEMKHSPNRDYTLPQLEGESDEDYERARRKARKKEVARDDKDQRKRNIADELELDEEQIGEIDDFDNFKINMDGVFDDYTDTQESVSAAVAEAVSEDAREQGAAAPEARKTVEEWNATEAELIKNLSDNADEQEKELIRQIVPNYVQPQTAEEPAAAADGSEEITFTPEELILRKKLDELKEQDVLVHKKRGVGEVIDNSDANIIQVRFDRDLRFLKKDKLVKKHLVDL